MVIKLSEFLLEKRSAPAVADKAIGWAAGRPRAVPSGPAPAPSAGTRALRGGLGILGAAAGADVLGGAISGLSDDPNSAARRIGGALQAPSRVLTQRVLAPAVGGVQRGMRAAVGATRGEGGIQGQAERAIQERQQGGRRLAPSEQVELQTERDDLSRFFAGGARNQYRNVDELTGQTNLTTPGDWGLIATAGTPGSTLAYGARPLTGRVQRIFTGQTDEELAEEQRRDIGDVADRAASIQNQAMRGGVHLLSTAGKSKEDIAQEEATARREGFLPLQVSKPLSEMNSDQVNQAAGAVRGALSDRKSQERTLGPVSSLRGSQWRAFGGSPGTSGAFYRPSNRHQMYEGERPIYERGAVSPEAIPDMNEMLRIRRDAARQGVAVIPRYSPTGGVSRGNGAAEAEHARRSGMRVVMAPYNPGRRSELNKWKREQLFPALMTSDYEQRYGKGSAAGVPVSEIQSRYTPKELSTLRARAAGIGAGSVTKLRRPGDPPRKIQKAVGAQRSLPEEMAYRIGSATPIAHLKERLRGYDLPTVRTRAEMRGPAPKKPQNLLQVPTEAAGARALHGTPPKPTAAQKITQGPTTPPSHSMIQTGQRLISQAIKPATAPKSPNPESVQGPTTIPKSKAPKPPPVNTKEPTQPSVQPKLPIPATPKPPTPTNAARNTGAMRLPTDVIKYTPPKTESKATIVKPPSPPKAPPAPEFTVTKPETVSSKPIKPKPAIPEPPKLETQSTYQPVKLVRPVVGGYGQWR